MSGQSSELPNLKVNKYRDGTWRITLSNVYLFNLNELHSKEEGCNLFSLAEINPTAAYGYIRQAIGGSIVHFADQITSTDKQGVAVKTDDAETTRQLAIERVLGCLPASYEGPFNVAIHLFTSKDEQDRGLGESFEVSQLHVEASTPII
jgi:hypothetical protein